MPPVVFQRRVALPFPPEFVFDWHTRPGAFERLSPPWQAVELVEKGQGVADGSRVVVRLHFGPLSKQWVAEHRGVVPGREFRDVQVAGPFAAWEHAHRVEPADNGGAILEDHIEYAVPLGDAGARLGGAFVRGELERLFNYRHAVTACDMAWHWAHREIAPMNILISGSTGLIGNALIPLLTTGGHEVVRLVRTKSRTPSKEIISWDPDTGFIDAAGLEGIDAVVHLAGEPVANGRWTAAKKARIRESRYRGTKLLCEAVAQLANPPKVFVCASAIGYYGDRGDEVLTEASPPGTGFLADACQEWEAMCEPARQKGIRVVNLRIGIVLSPAGGALAKMLTPFKLGLGGTLGSGKQFMSPIALDDMIGTIAHALVTPSLSGPANAVCPHPVTNYEFTKTLGKVLGRPTIFPAPAPVLRLALGEMADELLLASTRVEPRRLMETGYQFRYPTVEAALRHVLGK